MNKNYGIPMDETHFYVSKITGGKCEICHKPLILAKGKYAIDHCHKTGKIRGVLCQQCNQGLGCFQDDVVLIQDAIQYLRKYGS